MIKGMDRYTRGGRHTLQRQRHSHSHLLLRILLVLYHPVIWMFLLPYAKVNAPLYLPRNILLHILFLMIISILLSVHFPLLFPKNLFPGITKRQAGFLIGSRQWPKS